jgi:hypothetical protein
MREDRYTNAKGPRISLGYFSIHLSFPFATTSR